MSSNFPPTVTQTLSHTFPSVNFSSHLTRGDLTSIKDLPAQRPLTWTSSERQPRTATHRAFFTSEKDNILTSVVVQVAGVKADTPCKRCVDGHGEWEGCVIPPAQHGLKTWWACANCFRDGKTGDCELYLKTEQLNKLKKSLLPPMDPRFPAPQEGMSSGQQQQNYKFNMAPVQSGMNIPSSQAPQSAMTGQYSTASFQIGQLHQGNVPSTPQGYGKNTPFNQGHNLNHGQNSNSYATPHLSNTSQASFLQNSQANHPSQANQFPNQSAGGNQAFNQVSQGMVNPISNSNGHIQRPHPSPIQNANSYIRRPLSSQNISFDFSLAQNSRPSTNISTVASATPTQPLSNEIPGDKRKRASPQNASEPRKSATSPSLSTRATLPTSPLSPAQPTLPARPVTYAPGAVVRPTQATTGASQPSLPVSSANRTPITPKQTSGINQSGLNQNGFIKNGANQNGVNQNRAGQNIVAQNGFNKNGLNQNAVNQSVSTPRKGYAGGSQPGLMYVSTPPPVFTPPRASRAPSAEQATQAQIVVASSSSPIGPPSSRPPIQGNSITVASPIQQSALVAQRAVAPRQANRTVPQNNSITVASPQVQQKTPVQKSITVKPAAQALKALAGSMPLHSSRANLAPDYTNNSMNGKKKSADGPSGTTNQTTAEQKSAGELTIDNIMDIPSEMELDPTPSSPLDPSLVVPPVNISMRPGNVPSDEVLEQIMTPDNNIMWPTLDWEYLDAMREVGQLVDEPLMTLDELGMVVDKFYGP